MSVIKGLTSVLATPDFRRLDTIAKITAFDSLCEVTFIMASTGDDWIEIYDEIFGGSIGKAAETILEEAGLRAPEYCDPDTTYREDALAWATTIRGCFQAYADGQGKIQEILKG